MIFHTCQYIRAWPYKYGRLRNTELQILPCRILASIFRFRCPSVTIVTWTFMPIYIDFEHWCQYIKYSQNYNMMMMTMMTPPWITWWQWQRHTLTQRQNKTQHVPYFWNWYDSRISNTMMAEESGGDAMQVVMRCMWRCTAGGDTTQVTMKMVTQNSHSLLRSSSVRMKP